jgi:threonyl-tRNA synthetase
MNVTVYDTTLRDGMQGEGMSLSVEEKVRVARILDELGVPMIEAGFPTSNPKEMELFERLREAGLRADVDDRTESVGRKIRDAELRKIPYMLVIGDREAEQQAVSVRRHGQGDDGVVPVGDLVSMLELQARERS